MPDFSDADYADFSELEYLAHSLAVPVSAVERAFRAARIADPSISFEQFRQDFENSLYP